MKVIVYTLLFLAASCSSTQKVKNQPIADSMQDEYPSIVFGGGCFWCVEGIFETIDGVVDVVSGYSGGKAETATYKLTSTGQTDHAEVVKITYDPAIISYECLIKIFYESHDPTTLNQQGPDKGYEYRSVVFYKNEKEKSIVANYIKELEEKEIYNERITTTLEPFKAFYPAEDYHQDFKKRNKNHPYILSVSVPRLKEFQAKHTGCD